MLASPRGLSQLSTSFIAYLRQGIHTHALSSLTIKFTLDTEYLLALTTPYICLTAWLQLVLPINIQLSKIFDCLLIQQPGHRSHSPDSCLPTSDSLVFGGPG